MFSLITILKESRLALDLKIKDIARLTQIDQAIISKIEAGNRTPTEKQLPTLAEAYQLNYGELRKYWVAQRLERILQYEQNRSEIMMVLESRVEYLTGKQPLNVPSLSDELKSQLEVIDDLRKQWQDKKPLDALQLAKMKDYFKIDYTFESNRIEGNTLTLQETQLIVNEGLTIGGKTMNEHLEAINHAEAIELVWDLVANKEDISKRNLLDLHTLILKSIDTRNAGKYRTVPVMISGSAHKPPQPYLIDKLMEDYFLHYHLHAKAMHPVILAAEMHERLVSIHPFIDGNGRTSRLVMNLVLLKNGYTIANLKGDASSRIAYYQALEKVQIDNEPRFFYRLVADATEQSLKAHLALT